MKKNSPIVSFDSDELILVNERDEMVGFESKGVCHNGDGLLHRAFSVFLFDSKQRLLLQKRSADKRLWPLAWTNSCCSHPRKNELLVSAAHRRVEEELGVRVKQLHYLYKFVYHAHYGTVGSEYELCSVYIGALDGAEVSANDNEVNDWRFVDAAQLDAETQARPDEFTPWMILEWQRLRSEYWPQIGELCHINVQSRDGLADIC